MKNKVIIAAVGLFIILTAFKSATTDVMAKPSQRYGMYVFSLSSPTLDYEVVGSVKPLYRLFNDPVSSDNNVDKMCQIAKEKYPGATAIIIKSADMDRADVIKFKEQ